MLQRNTVPLTVLLIALAMPSFAADMITIRPARDNSMLLNPGKGWVQYYGTDKYTRDYISVGYTRWAWSAIEPKEGRYHWKAVDDFIRQFRQYGKKAAFGVMNVSTGIGQQYVTPKWVFDAGAAPLAVPDASSPTGQHIIPKNVGRPGLPAEVPCLCKAPGQAIRRQPGHRLHRYPLLRQLGRRTYGMLNAPGVVLTPPDNLKQNYFLPYFEAFPRTQLIIPWGNDNYESVYDWAVEPGGRHAS